MIKKIENREALITARAKRLATTEQKINEVLKSKIFVAEKVTPLNKPVKAQDLTNFKHLR